MFLSERPNVYEKVYAEVVGRLAAEPLAANAARLGLAVQDGAVRVPLLGRGYLVDAHGVRNAQGDKAPLTHRLVLAYYLLHRGGGETAGRYVPYRELPGGADFARALSEVVEGRLARAFSGRVPELLAAAADLGGEPAPVEVRAELAQVFPVLPHIPLMLTFYDADEDFGAEAKVFYDLTAPNFLDMECLAVLAQILVVELEETARAKG
ncbi:MAG: DUF3786 domain-containing protein [Deltaproteobacteria bacterium]|nr:DUF3786 domain-containing protein [Deltaproteobacteria bacterium]